MQKTGAYITAVAIVPVTTAHLLVVEQVKNWVHNAMFCVLVCAANAIYFPISIGLKKKTMRMAYPQLLLSASQNLSPTQAVSAHLPLHFF